MTVGDEAGPQGGEDAMPVTAAYFFLSVLAGFLASGSLTLGSLTGVLLQPNAAKTGTIYAFGAGALLAALAVVLIAPTIANVSDPSYIQQHGAAQAKLEVIILAVSSLIGGGVFVLLEELLSNRGAGIKKWLKSIKNVDMDKLGGRSVAKRNQLFGKSEFFSALTATNRLELSRAMRYVCYHPNDVIFAQGDDTRKLWVVKSGTVEMQVTPGESFHTHAVGDILGGLAFLTGQPQIMSAVATSDVEAYVVDYQVFIALMDAEPGLKVALMSDTANLLTLLANANRRAFAFRADILVQWQARLGQLVRVAYRQAARSSSASGSPSTRRADKSTIPSSKCVTLRVSDTPARVTGDSATPLTGCADAEEPVAGIRTPVSADNTSFLSAAEQPDTSVCSFHTAPSIARTSPGIEPPAFGTTPNPPMTSDDRGEVVVHDNPLAVALEVRQAQPTQQASSGCKASPSSHCSPSHDLFQAIASTLNFGTTDAADHFLQDLHAGESVPLSVDLDANNPLADRPEATPAALSAVKLKRLSAVLMNGAAASTNPEPVARVGHQREHYECQITGQRIALPEEEHEGSDDEYWLCDYENITRSMRSGGDAVARDTAQPPTSQRAFAHSMSWHASGVDGTAGPAPTGVWLGNLLDGPAEAIVIGVQVRHALSATHAAGSAVTVGAMIPWTLVAGLCLSNFPEAMAASMTMYQYGWSKRRVVLMWFALTAIISLGSGFGYLLASLLSHTTIVAFEGFASGGMLVMIIGSMIPEAAHLCGPSTTGMWLLAGFTAAYLFELLENGDNI